jgi:hypothetical protein
MASTSALLRRPVGLVSLVGLLAAACTYGPEQDAAQVSQIVQLGDSYRALIVVHHDRFRRPTGLSSFPDGGRLRFLERRALQYLVDASASTVVTLAQQAAADSLWESFSVGVGGLDGDSVAYLTMSGCERDGECHPALRRNVTLRLSMHGGLQPVESKPASASLPGVMLARRPGEQHYVRFCTDGALVTARFENEGPYQRLFRLQDDGGLAAMDDPVIR